MDTELWALALSDVRQRERHDRSRLDEIAVERRLRQQDRTKSAAEAEATQALLDGTRTLLAEAAAERDRELGRARGELEGAFGAGASSAQLGADLAACQREQEEHRAMVLAPLQRGVIEALRQRGQVRRCAR